MRTKLILTFDRRGGITEIHCEAEYGRFFAATLETAAEMLAKFSDVRMTIAWPDMKKGGPK